MQPNSTTITMISPTLHHIISLLIINNAKKKAFVCLWLIQHLLKVGWNQKIIRDMLLNCLGGVFGGGTISADGFITRFSLFRSLLMATMSNT